MHIFIHNLRRAVLHVTVSKTGHFPGRFLKSTNIESISTSPGTTTPLIRGELLFSLHLLEEGVKQMQISEQPEAPARLNLSPSSCQSQIIASTTKRHGQFRNRFRKIGESNSRRHAHFCVQWSPRVQTHTKGKMKAYWMLMCWMATAHEQFVEAWISGDEIHASKAFI